MPDDDVHDVVALRRPRTTHSRGAGARRDRPHDRVRADRVKLQSTYEGDQLRTREAYVKDAAGNFVKTLSDRDDLRFFHDTVTGNLECITTFGGSRNTCDTASQPTVSDQLVADYAYTEDDKLRASRAWDRINNLSGTPDDESIQDYDALDRPVQEREHHRNRGWQTARLTKLSYLGVSGQVSEEQQFRITDIATPAGQAILDETKQYSYSPHGQRLSLTDTIKGQNGAPDQTRTHLYGYDPHGNVSLLLTEAGVPRASYDYTPLGEPDNELTAELRPDASGPSADPSQFLGSLNGLNPYRYSGKRFDSGTGQLDMGARRFAPRHRAVPTGGHLPRRTRRSRPLARSSDPAPLRARGRQPDLVHRIRRAPTAHRRPG